MNEYKFAMLCSTVVHIVYIVCVTMAAIHFESAALLWWYVLVLLFGYK